MMFVSFNRKSNVSSMYFPENATIEDFEINSEEDIRNIEKQICEKLQYKDVKLLYWKKL